MDSFVFSTKEKAKIDSPFYNKKIFSKLNPISHLFGNGECYDIDLTRIDGTQADSDKLN